MPNPADAKKVLATLLREHGFKGSAPTFRRFEGKASVALVNLQASRAFAGGTYVNLGVHHRGLEKPSSWEKIQEYECAFQERLKDFAGGDVFFFDDDASVTALVEMMKLEGLPWLERKSTPKKGAAKKPAAKKAAAKKATAKKTAAKKTAAKKTAPRKATAKKVAAKKPAAKKAAPKKAAKAPTKRGAAKSSTVSARKAPAKAARTPKKKASTAKKTRA